jgi:hypothetical protein
VFKFIIIIVFIAEQLRGFDPSPLGSTTAPVEEAYQELSAKEEADLEQILSGCEWSISNVESLTERLTEELMSLDNVSDTYRYCY